MNNTATPNFIDLIFLLIQLNIQIFKSDTKMHIQQFRSKQKFIKTVFFILFSLLLADIERKKSVASQGTEKFSRESEIKNSIKCRAL